MLILYQNTSIIASYITFFYILKHCIYNIPQIFTIVKTVGIYYYIDVTI